MAVVIIPAYRPDYELGNIAQTMYELCAKLIVVDDGSGNEFADRFEDICTVLRHDENRGKGAAIKTALTYIKNNMPGALILGVREIGRKMPFRSRFGNGIQWQRARLPCWRCRYRRYTGGMFLDWSNPYMDFSGHVWMMQMALYIAVLILGLTRSVGHRRRKQELRTER